MIERGNPPYQGQVGPPGGLVEEDEDLDVCAHRELEEETKVTDVSLEQLHAFGAPHRDPRGRLVTVAYYTLVRPDRLHPAAASDAANVRWFAVDALPSLAFDHAEIIAMARRRLRARLDESVDAFGFLPKTFTMEDLRTLVEIVGGERLDPAALSAPGVGPRADRGYRANKGRDASTGSALSRAAPKVIVSLRNSAHVGSPSGETRTITLPKFSPRKSPIKARGAFSRPSTMSSRYLMRPSRTSGPTSARKSGCWLAKSNTMKPRSVSRFVNTLTHEQRNPIDATR